MALWRKAENRTNNVFQILLLMGITAVISTASSMAAANQNAKGNAESMEVLKIWDQAPHNAFTDLIRFKDQWVCVFREGESYHSKHGKIRVITSGDGRTWTSTALLTVNEKLNMCYPKLTMAPDGRLMLTARGSYSARPTCVWFSTDAREWGEPVTAPGYFLWLTSVRWHKDTAYSLSCRQSGVKPPGFWASTDGVKFKPLVGGLEIHGHPGEASLVFTKDDTCLALMRRDHVEDSCLLGSARPPYTKWTWKDLGIHIGGGPNLIRLPDGRYLAAGRCYDSDEKRQPCTVLLWLDVEKGSLEPFLKLPSGQKEEYTGYWDWFKLGSRGDTGYPGLVFHKDRLWVSYHSSHEGKASIYLAKVKLAPKDSIPKRPISVSRRFSKPFVQEAPPVGPPAVKLQLVDGMLTGVLSQRPPRNKSPWPFQLPNGDILVVWCYSRTTPEDSSEIGHIASVSRDMGKTWSKTFTFFDFPGVRDCYARLLRVGDTVHFFAVVEDIPEYRGRMFSTYTMRTEDSGKTWTKPRQICQDRFTEHPLLLKNGEILFSYFYPWLGACLASADNGKTWQKRGIIDPRKIGGEPTLVERKDGSIYCLMRNHDLKAKKKGTANLFESVSTDRGKTWSKIRKSGVRSIWAPPRLLRLKSGRILLTWCKEYVEGVEGYSPSRPWYPLSAALSEDEGATWKYVRDISSKKFTMNNHGACQLSDGRILLTGTSASLKIHAFIFDEKWIMGGKKAPTKPADKAP